MAFFTNCFYSMMVWVWPCWDYTQCFIILTVTHNSYWRFPMVVSFDSDGIWLLNYHILVLYNNALYMIELKLVDLCSGCTISLLWKFNIYKFPRFHWNINMIYDMVYDMYNYSKCMYNAFLYLVVTFLQKLAKETSGGDMNVSHDFEIWSISCTISCHIVPQYIESLQYLE